MQADYKSFTDRMIDKYEGPYGWDSGDPGGPTKYGITCYDLAEYRNQRMSSMSHWAPIVRAMSLDEAEAIYVKKYASKDRFNDLKPGADCVIMDYGVNSGVVRPIHVAQALFRMPVNNLFSDDLLKKINDSDIKVFVNNMCNERMRYLQSLHTWRKFGRGWSARVIDLRAYCLHLATAPAPMPPPITVVPTPAPVVQPTQPEFVPPKVPGMLGEVEAWVEGLVHPTGKGIEHPEMLSTDTSMALPAMLG